MPNDMDRPPAAGPNYRSRILPLENWSPNPSGDLFFRPDARQVFYAIMVAMPRDGAIIFSDLIGKLDSVARGLREVRARWQLSAEWSHQ